METMPLLSEMHRVRQPEDMHKLTSAWTQAGNTIALVPTMGALHAGHLSLIDLARKQADKVVVSIFINPFQFGPNESFDAYPRSLSQDESLCMGHGVDALFVPAAEAIYPDNFSSYIAEDKISQRLCGASRPQYFKGISTATVILLNIIQPKCLILGQKGIQRAAVIQKIVKDLRMPVEVLVAPLVREADGLAMSSRSCRLQEHQRRDGIKIYEALLQGKRLIDEGVTSPDRVMAEVTHHLAGSPYIRVVHVSLVSRDTFDPMTTVMPGQGILAVGAWLDQERWVDNILV
ncbi:MAG: pantoate--beta-alanine ligase [Opitutales bacterium]